MKFSRKAWPKPYIDMTTKLRKKANIYLFNFINNAVFEKTIENVRKHRNIKFVTTERKRNYLVS